jgi:integrase
MPRHNPNPEATDARGRVCVEPIFAEPFKGQRMARREHQMPNVLRQKGPRPYWYVRYRLRFVVDREQVERREQWKRLGYCDEMTRREAERLRDQVIMGVNNQLYVVRNQTPLREFVQRYLELHVVTLQPGAKQKYESLLKNHILPSLGEERMCDLGVLELQGFINTKANEELSWWTRNDLKGILSGIFTKATDWGYWEGTNPAKKISLGRKSGKRQKRILTDEQTRLLLRESPFVVKLMIELAISTGMRISELLGLRWRCIDLERGFLRVEERYYRGHIGEPKSDNSKRILSLGNLSGVLRTFRPTDAGDDQFVFQEGGTPLDDRKILRDVIRPIAMLHGFYFEGLGWHSFRRQNLTVIQEEGATAFEAMAQAGHSRPLMTSEYTVVVPERRVAAVRRLQERVLGGVVN